MVAISKVCSDESFHIYEGDTTDIIYVAPDILDGGTIDANWTCYQRVLDPQGNEAIAKVQVTTKTTDNTEFKVFLIPSQTANLTTSDTTKYTWVIEVENSSYSPHIKKELHLDLYVHNEGIT